MQVTSKITIHLDDQWRLPPIDAMQGDAYTRVLEFTLYSGGVAWNVPDGASVAVAYSGSSGQGAYDTLPSGDPAYTVAGNVVTAILIPQVVAVAGNTTVTIVFTDANGKQLATFGVTVRVAPNPAVGAGEPAKYYNLREWASTPLYVTLSGNSNDGFTTDVSFEDIRAAHEQEKEVRCLVGNAVCYLYKISPAFALFRTADGTAHYQIRIWSDSTVVYERFEYATKEELLPDVTDEKYFDIDYDGIVSLKAEYRGHPAKATYSYAVSDNGVGVDGSKINELPEVIVVPDVIAGTAVSGFQPGMFYFNERVKEITIPDAVHELPGYFCRNAVYLKAIHNTEQITKICGYALSYTRVEKIAVPNLKEVEAYAFAAAGFLYAVDIGDYLTELPESCFQQDPLLSLVKGGSKVTKIGKKAFYLTSNLKNLPLLSHVTSIGDDAFYRSRVQFDWASIADKCTFGARATPVIDNTTDFWTGVEYTPCENRLVTKMSQKNAAWKNEVFGESGYTYHDGCAVFSILHIHSAFTGKVYTHPDEFAEDVRAIDPSLLTAENHPRLFDKAANMLEALGYKVTKHKSSITQEAYQGICDALARGAYIYATVGAESDVNGGHALILYGMNDIGEVLVLDSGRTYENYRASGISDDLNLFRIPYQNITGPESWFMIVEKNSAT